MRKCPICKKPLIVDDFSDGVISEVYETCMFGCRKYNYTEWCGQSCMTLGRTDLFESWSSSKTRFNKNKFIYKRMVARLRKAYLKELRMDK